MQKKILIADAHPESHHALLDLLLERLTSWELVILLAEDGYDACEAAVHARPDLILLAAMISGLTGPEVVEKLRLHPDTRDIIVIMLSTLDWPQDRDIAAAAGVDEFIPTPYDPAYLLERIEAALSRSSSA